MIPGILLGLGLCVPAYIISVKRHYPKHDKANWVQRIKALKDSVWALLMPLILLGGILSGVFTPTESSIVTCVYALIVGVFVYKEIKITDVPRIVWDNIRNCSACIALVGLAGAFGYILTQERVPQLVANAILGVTDNKIIIILIINVFLLFVGMFMESMSAILITFPVLFPIASKIGMDGVQFAVMAVLNLMVGLTTPPVGTCMIAAAQIGNTSTFKAFKANMPFLLTSLIILLLTAFVRPITMLIPTLFG